MRPGYPNPAESLEARESKGNTAFAAMELDISSVIRSFAVPLEVSRKLAKRCREFIAEECGELKIEVRRQRWEIPRKVKHG